MWQKFALLTAVLVAAVVLESSGKPTTGSLRLRSKRDLALQYFLTNDPYGREEAERVANQERQLRDLGIYKRKRQQLLPRHAERLREALREEHPFAHYNE